MEKNMIKSLGAFSGLGGGSAKPKYVAQLPDVGEDGVLYLVPTGQTRDGYQIYQEFVYENGAWRAIGAYDVGINPEGLLFEDSFNASTNTLTLTKNS